MPVVETAPWMLTVFGAVDVPPVAKIAFVLFVVMAIDPLLVTVPVPPSLTVCVVVSGPSTVKLVWAAA